MNKTYFLSPSTLNLFKDCPRCFWLQFNRDIKRPSGIFPSLPSGVDRILKKHFDSFVSKKNLPPELEKSEIKGFKLFENLELLEEWRDNRRGLRWTDEKGNVILGAIDNLLEKDGKLVILDYKTKGFPLKENSADYYLNQLEIYNFLLRKKGFETEDFGFLLFYVPEGVEENGNFVFDTTLIKVDLDIKNAERLIRDALDFLNGKCPKNSESCDWCKWISDEVI